MSFSIFFNIEYGYLEGVVRGFKNGILRSTDYQNLVQCETLNDLKLHIQNTDYGHILASDEDDLDVEIIETKVREKMMMEFNYLRDNSSEPLTTFLDYLRYKYMIDNLAMLISCMNNDVPMKKALSLCHPMGMFEQMAAIEVVDNMRDLYNIILVDTPLYSFLGGVITDEVFLDVNVEVIRNYMLKNYLEHFHKFCKDLGGTTADVMCRILDFEADKRAILLTINSIDLFDPSERLELFAKCGHLYPTGLYALAVTYEEDAVRAILNSTEYGPLFEHLEADGMLTLEDRFQIMEAKLHMQSYMRQFHFGVFYSYFKLKDLESRNITWIAECIEQRQRDHIHLFVPIPID